MKRLKGNIKTVTPKNVTNGMSVLHFCNTWEILIIDCIANGVLYFTGKTDGLSISEVRILVVEYNIVNYDIIKRKRTVKFKMWIFVPSPNK
jgi:hypothetical protein